MTVSKIDRSARHGVHEALARIILAGWKSTKEGTQQKFISNEEMHDVLLQGGEHFKLQVLWQLEIWFKQSEEEYTELIPVFFSNVWPRQISAKTSAISLRLLDITFLSSVRFPESVKAIIPLLTTINYSYSNIIFPD